MGAGHNVNNAYTPSTTTRVVYSCGFCKRTHTRLGRTILPNVMCSLSSYGIVGSTHTVTTLRVTATAVNHLRECVRSFGTGVGVRLKAGDRYWEDWRGGVWGGAVPSQLGVWGVATRHWLEFGFTPLPQLPPLPTRRRLLLLLQKARQGLLYWCHTTKTSKIKRRW